MNSIIASLASGVIFGLGLAISGMTNPAKIIGFVDITGQWDPSLIFVMVGAVIVYGIGFRLAQRSGTPMFAPKFQVPTRNDIDTRLIAGGALFGVGWGLAGVCPGPAITALAFGMEEFYVFFAAMAAGSLIYGLTMKPKPSAPSPAPAE